MSEQKSDTPVSQPPVAEALELLPCPWCTVPPEVTKAAGYGFRVECVNETCQVAPCLSVTRGRQNAIKSWNTRVDPASSITEKAERLAEKIVGRERLSYDWVRDIIAAEFQK